MRWLLALCLALGACDDGDGVDGAGVAEACVEGDLIAQCPPGSDPQLDARAQSACGSAGEANLITEGGAFTGKCYGEGECVVLCQFEAPCPCGVDAVTEAGVFCAACEEVAACGDGACEGGETPDSCPRDCGAECPPDRERCQGDDKEVCDLTGRWARVACGEGRRCEEAGEEVTCVDR